MAENDKYYARIAHASYQAKEWIDIDKAAYEEGSETKTGLVLYAGEIGFESDTGKFKIGNGSTRWSELDYWRGILPITKGYSLGSIMTGEFGGTINCFSGLRGAKIDSFDLTNKAIVLKSNFTDISIGDKFYIFENNTFLSNELTLQKQESNTLIFEEEIKIAPIYVSWKDSNEIENNFDYNQDKVIDNTDLIVQEEMDITLPTTKNYHLIKNNDKSWGDEDIGQNALSLGTNCITYGADSISVGSNLKTYGSHAANFGANNLSAAYGGFVTGVYNTNLANHSIIGGYCNDNMGQFSFLIGSKNRNYGKHSLLSGLYNINKGTNCTQFGRENYIDTSALNIVQNGVKNKTYGNSYNSLLVGNSNQLNGNENAILVGSGNSASKSCNNIGMIGESLRASRSNSFIIGEYNVSNADNIFTVGNGDNSNDRSNAFCVDKSGNMYIQTAGYIGEVKDDNKIATLKDIPGAVDLTGYARKDYVDTEINNTKVYVDTEINNTKVYVNTTITNLGLPESFTNYVQFTSFSEAENDSLLTIQDGKIEAIAFVVNGSY